VQARSTNKFAKGKGKGKPSRSDQYKKKGPPLDGRLRADKRGQKAAENRSKGKSAKGGHRANKAKGKSR
jgi:hypothetical protein